MDALNNLINQKVIAVIRQDEHDYEIKGTVMSFDINDFYFHEKGEPIYISVSIKPDEKLPPEIDTDELMEVPIDQIRKAW
jgi:hypothetical protein